jgi:hypothetical protein
MPAGDGHGKRIIRRMPIAAANCAFQDDCSPVPGPLVMLANRRHDPAQCRSGGTYACSASQGSSRRPYAGGSGCPRPSDSSRRARSSRARARRMPTTSCPAGTHGLDGDRQRLRDAAELQRRRRGLHQRAEIRHHVHGHGEPARHMPGAPVSCPEPGLRMTGTVTGTDQGADQGMHGCGGTTTDATVVTVMSTCGSRPRPG